MATGEVSTLRTRVTMDTVEFAKGAQEVNRELRLLRSESKLASTDMKRFGNSTDSQKNKLNVLSREEIGLRKAIELNRAEYDKYKRAQELSGDASQANTSKMTAAANAMTKNEEKLSKVRREMDLLNTQILRQESSWYKLGTGLEKAGGKVTKFSKGMKTFANNAMKVSATVGVIGGLAIKTAIDWESAVVSMEKTIEGTPQQMKEVENAIRDMALEVPIAANELAELAATAGQLGVEAEDIPKFTKVVADLSVATNIAGEEGSRMLAQFANVTQMDTSNIDRLGSAITLLGNNTATTEQDILEMSQLLAGAGESAGLAQPDIVGIAAALSSLGIAAERGGSSFSKIMINMAVASETGIKPLRELETASGMTRRELELLASNNSADFKSLADSLGMTTSEINNIVKAGGDLEGFAEVAGMSAEQFSKAFGEDASNAIGLFIDGLAQGDAQSESTIEILDSLGISEIRLRDTLLRTGNAQGLLNESVDLANQGWNENTALTEEAERRYGSTESQLQLLRNKLQDVAITAGERLLPAFNDLIDNADGVIDVVGDAVEWFTGLDEETQQLAFNTGLLVVALGPVAKTIAGITGAAGDLLTGSGKLIKYFANIGIESKKAKLGVSGMSTALSGTAANATSTGTSILGFKGILSGLGAFITSPAGIVVALGAVATGLYVVSQKAKESKEEVERWGFDIDEQSEKAINKFQELGDEASVGTYQMATNVEEGTSRALEAYEEMVSEITTSAQETITEAEENFAKLPAKAREIAEELMTDRIESQNDVIAEAELINTEINKVYARALEENRELTASELEIIEGFHKDLSDLRAETLELSAEEERKVQAVMANELSQFSENQLQMRRDYLNEEYAATRDVYADMQSELETQLAEGEITTSKYNDSMKKLNESRHENDLFFTEEYVKLWNAMGLPVEQQIETLERMGVSHEEIMTNINIENAKAAASTRYLTEDMEGMTEETEEANNMWNDFSLENKFGEVDTNVEEVIQQASETEEGWKMLEFVLKHANLTTTAEAAIQEALEANGTWEEMRFDPQSAPLFTNALETAREYMKAEGSWDELNFEEQTAILDTNTPEQLKQILQDYGIWENDIDPAVKEMIMKSNVPSKTEQAERAVSGWNNSPDPKAIPLDATTNASTVARAAQEAIDGVKSKRVYITTEYAVTNARLAPHNMGVSFMRANGTNHHGGGAVILGDGGKREPFLTPEGNFGISPDKDTMYNLSKGTKVWSSIARFKADAQQNTLLESLINKLPHFATGTSDSFLESNRFPNVFSGNQSNTESSGNNFNIVINAIGDLPYTTIQRMAKQIEKEIKRSVDSDKFNRGV